MLGRLPPTYFGGLAFYFCYKSKPMNTMQYSPKQIENFKRVNEMLRDEERKISKIFLAFGAFVKKIKQEETIQDYEFGLIISVFTDEEVLLNQFQIEDGGPLFIGYASLPTFQQSPGCFFEKYSTQESDNALGFDWCFSMQAIWDDLQYFEDFDFTKVCIELSFQSKGK